MHNENNERGKSLDLMAVSEVKSIFVKLRGDFKVLRIEEIYQGASAKDDLKFSLFFFGGGGGGDGVTCDNKTHAT